MQEEALESGAKEMGIQLSGKEYSERLNSLVDRLNELIATDFQKLVSLLYRADVSESRLRALLAENPAEDAAKLIAALLIEREIRKIKSRKEFRQRPLTDDDEHW